MPEITGEKYLITSVHEANIRTRMFGEGMYPYWNEFPNGFIKVCKLHYFLILFEILPSPNACSNPCHAIFPGVSRHGVLDLCAWSQCVTTSLLTNALLQYLQIFPSANVLIRKSSICISHHLCCREPKQARWHLPYSKEDSEATNRTKREFSSAGDLAF